MEKVPDEVLEMSFFKLLEHFFYNQRISVSGKRDQEANNLGEEFCNHALFRTCDLIFRFGPTKVHLKYEALDVYSLDMFHFGL